MNSKFPFRLLALLLVLATVFFLSSIGALAPVQAVALVILFQAAMFLVEQRQAAAFISGFSDSQVREIENILSGMKGYDGMFKKLFKKMEQCGGPDEFLRRYDDNETTLNDLRKQVKQLRQSGVMGSGVRTIGGVDYVSPDAGHEFMSDLIVDLAGLDNGKRFRELIPEAGKRDRLIGMSRGAPGFSGRIEKAAEGTGQVPLPTIYMPQIVELVWKYGQARQFGTVYPLGAGTVKLPQLQAGESNFSFLGVGTAGMSQAVGEKQVTANLVTFTASKLGGLIRVPTEIEDDTFIQLGQFLARYVARQFAKMEDTSMFLGDGTGTYANITGVGPYCVANPAYLLQLGAGKTKPSDATVNDFTNLRAKVNPAVLVDDPAYYVNPTMEGLFVSFNTIGQPLRYQRSMGPGMPATFDGFPIRWVGVMQPYSTAAAAGTFLAAFGALNYWYLGERGMPRIEVSREVFFSTDEIAMRALERIDIEPMAVDAMSALATAAA